MSIAIHVVQEVKIVIDVIVSTPATIDILKLKTPSSFSPLEILYSFTVNFFVVRELAGIGLFKKTCVKAEKMPRRCQEKFTVLIAFIISRDLSERWSVEQVLTFVGGM